MSSTLFIRPRKLITSTAKSPTTASTLDCSPTKPYGRPSVTKREGSSGIKINNYAPDTYFHSSTSRKKTDEDSRNYSSGLYSLEKGYKSLRGGPGGVVEPPKKIKLKQMAAPNLLKSPKSLPFIHIPKSALGLSSLSPLGFTTQTDTSSTQILTPRRDLDYSMQEYSITSNPHFSKFNEYFQAINSAEIKKSPLSREIFYYPDQVQTNVQLAERFEEMRKQETFAISQLRSTP